MIRKIDDEHDCVCLMIKFMSKNDEHQQVFDTYFRYVMQIFRLQIQHLLATTVSPSLV